MDYTVTAIKLKPMCVNDITDEYVEWHSQPHAKFYSGFGRPFTRDRFLREMEGGTFFYGIYVSDDHLIGSVKIGPVDRHGVSDMPTFIGDPGFLGRGVGVTAIKMGCSLAFGKYKVRKLAGGVHATNAPSLGAHLKAGWHVEGTLVDHYVVDGQPVDRILLALFSPWANQWSYEGEFDRAPVHHARDEEGIER